MSAKHDEESGYGPHAQFGFAQSSQNCAFSYSKVDKQKLVRIS